VDPLVPGALARHSSFWLPKSHRNNDSELACSNSAQPSTFTSNKYESSHCAQLKQSESVFALCVTNHLPPVAAQPSPQEWPQHVCPASSVKRGKVS
jgi:hypothetical protein